MRGPLDGYRILDTTTMLSGPWATMILADQGADVIKIEAPERGDHVRHLGNRRGGMSAMFLNINRNKRSVAIDLRTEDGVGLLKRIAVGADVFVQNFRPGVVERLGIGERDLRKIAPEIIYASISGFGENGPWAHKPAYDPIIQALSGLTTVQGGSDTERPRLVRTVLADKLSAVVASQAITAALVARERTGQGQHVRVSMLDTMLSFLWASDMSVQTYPDNRQGSQPTASFIDLIYETKDGYMTVAVMSDKEWAGLTRALERPEWLDDPRFRTPATATWIAGFLVGVPAGFLDIGTLSDLSNIGTLFAFVLVSIGVIILRYRDPGRHRGFRAPGGIAAPVLSVFFCVLLMSGLPILTWLRFFAWLVIGLSIYYLYSRHHSEFAGKP